MSNISKFEELNNTYEPFIELFHELCDVSGEIISQYFRKNIEVKDKLDKGPRMFSPVTEADRNSEQAIRNLINQNYPGHGIRGEEYGDERTDSEYVWVIDPIDGTKAFITGFPTWGTLIALQKNGIPIIGAMNQPFVGERFIGKPGKATLNDQLISTRKCSRLSDAIVGITELEMLTNASQRAAFDTVAERANYVRLGGDCYNYCLLAAGHIDLVIEGSLMPWDIQALIPIVEAAGGIITGWTGEPVTNHGWVVAAGDPKIHAEAISFLSNAEGV